MTKQYDARQVIEEINQRLRLGQKYMSILKALAPDYGLSQMALYHRLRRAKIVRQLREGD